jgi:hypothetical protein
LLATDFQTIQVTLPHKNKKLYKKLNYGVVGAVPLKTAVK